LAAKIEKEQKMLKRKNAIIAGAAIAALPVMSNAAVVTFRYDPGATLLQYSTTSNFAAGTTTSLTISGGAVNVPVNDWFRFAVDALVTSNSNPASGGAYDTSTNGPNGQQNQPANLGLAGFGFQITDSNNTALTPLQSGGTSTAVNPSGPLWSTYSSGNVDGSGTVGAGGALLSGGNNPANIKVASQGTMTHTTAGLASATVGAGANQVIFSNLKYKAGAAAGSATLTPSSISTGTAIVVVNSAGNASTPPTYKSQIVTTGDAQGDTLNLLPTLVVNVTGGTTSSSNKIISLTPASGGTVYGTKLTNGTGTNQATFNPNSPVANNINVTYLGTPGSYIPGFANNINNSDSAGTAGAATDTAEATGFNAGDLEVYALKLDVGTTRPSASQDSSIAAAINANSTGVTASVLAGGPFASEFPGYDIALTSAGNLGSSTDNLLAFDFSQETAVPGVTVTDIAAVPEPATAAGVLLGASGLLLGRRKRTITKA
jgi:hypothetical protein